MALIAFKSVLCGSIVLLLGVINVSKMLATAKSTEHVDKSVELLQHHLCRDTCSRKFAMDDMSCLQQYECSVCWDECTSSTNINKSILDTWSLKVQSMVRDNSLVSTNIAWHAANYPNDCLVTWEVSGGGLIGNLLTQSSNVELSLWPETKYRIQVTCKNKKTEEISRSLPLTLDTNKAIVMVRVPTDLTSTLSDVDDATNQMQEIDQTIMRDNESVFTTTYTPAEDEYFNSLKQTELRVKSTLDSLSDLFNRYCSSIEKWLLIIALVASMLYIVAAISEWKWKRQEANDKGLLKHEQPMNVDVERVVIHV